VRELLVISQDTSAYGVDLRYKLDFVGGRAVRTRMTELARELGQIALAHGAWVRLHYVYPYPHVDEIIPLMNGGGVLPYLDVPFQHSHPRVLKSMKRPASGEKNIERIRTWRAVCPELAIRSTFIAGFPGESEAEFEHLLEFLREAELDRSAASPIRRSMAPRRTSCRGRCRTRFAKSAAPASCRSRSGSPLRACNARSEAGSGCWSTKSARPWRSGAHPPMRPKSTVSST
jgi:ribosomal protein S12 methylthiotransferase